MMPELPDNDDLLAAELAFGLLDAAEQASAERRLLSDPAFAAAYRRWQDHAAELFIDANVAPPEGIWDAIAARLPANDLAREGTSLTQVRWWQAATAAAAMLAVASTTMLLTRPAPVPSAPAPILRPVARPLVALLASSERAGAVAIGYDPATRRLTALPSRVAAGSRVTELWIIPAGGVPHALGVIAADLPGARPVAPATAALIVPGATLAISLEPPGGSPTAAPTGPVILTGRVTVA